MYPPIKSKEFPNGKTMYELIDDPLIEVHDFIYTPFYYISDIKGATDKCIMRRMVYERLKMAESFLPEGYRLKIYDAWRPFEVQYSLYTNYRNTVAENNPTSSEEEIDEITKLFVSKPLKDEFEGPVHATGGAIDLTIVNSDGKELDMGTEFDHFGKEANTDYYENTDTAVKENRRMLYHAMTKAGFTNLPTEWWHYDYGNKFHAFYTGEKALYGCIFN